MWERSAASCTAPTSGLARNPGLCPQWESSPQPFHSQASALSSEPHRPGLNFFFFFFFQGEQKYQQMIKETLNSGLLGISV